MILLSYLIPHRNKRTSIARDDANLVALQQQTTTCFRHILPVSLMFILIRVCQRFLKFSLILGFFRFLAVSCALLGRSHRITLQDSSHKEG